MSHKTSISTFYIDYQLTQSLHNTENVGVKLIQVMFCHPQKILQKYQQHQMTKDSN